MKWKLKKVWLVSLIALLFGSSSFAGSPKKDDFMTSLSAALNELSKIDTRKLDKEEQIRFDDQIRTLRRVIDDRSIRKTQLFTERFKLMDVEVESSGGHRLITTLESKAVSSALQLASKSGFSSNSCGVLSKTTLPALERGRMYFVFEAVVECEYFVKK